VSVGLAGTVLIAGATGFIGSRLLQAGSMGMVRHASGLAGEVRGDLLNPASLRKACEGMNTIFHCAGFAHAFTSSDPAAHWRINYEGTRNLLTAAGGAGVKRFVFLSSVKAMADPGTTCVDEDWPGEPTTPYGQSKRAAEDAVLEAGAKYGMHVVNLRLAMVYGRGGKGNLERLSRGLRGGWFPRLPETGNRRSLVHVDDVVAAVRLVAERPEANGRTYIIADPVPYSGRDICIAILSVPPTRTLSWSVPAWTLRMGGRAGDLVQQWARRPLPLNSEVVARLLDSAWYSPARIERELGWRARIGLTDGVREMLAPVVAE